MKTKESQILEIVENHLLRVDELKSIKQTINCFWDCFLNSKIADDTEVRTTTYGHYLELTYLLEKLENLNL